MKLTYRGRQYDREKQNFLTSTGIANKEIIYRGNSPEAGINPKFPWIKYIQQLLYKSRAKTVFDPIAFWYDHKKEFLEDCWCLDQIECDYAPPSLQDRCWDLTLQIEKTKAFQPRQKTKLKYRGVTYYR
ncbi:DUF4278 domain-containing protein [Pleurocapsa sp. CCALA 161]|uniref:DUF4278 domain-containing protein n=1 Tax=Pleurocapsa sp. CCALA 161 TaxID=2107688 RepID=UPI000D0855CA|nr:DUF4278 domain-containing protein [Pleurocapsa sp. CCALA 161]PSB10079.1 DUF4278 domain-containing protein [Pleurocapsa sp. CCALA 161]